MNQVARSQSEYFAAAREYMTPSSPRKIVRKPRVEIEPSIVQIPFKDGRINLRCWGSGPIILLVHGWSANQTDMFGYVPEIVERRYCAVTMDLPAHGESTGEYAGLEELGDSIVAAGKYLGHLEGVVAHSVGAAAAHVALTKGLDTPKLVELASPQNYEANIQRFAARKGFNERETEELLKAFAELGVKTRIIIAEMPPPPHIEALIIHSNDDEVIPVQTAIDIDSYWHKSTLWRVDGLKHRGLLKDATTISKVVSYIIDGVQPI